MEINTEGTDDEFYNSIIDCVSDKMELLDMTVPELASSTGIDYNNLRKYLSRKRNVNFTTLKKLLIATDIKLFFE